MDQAKSGREISGERLREDARKTAFWKLSRSILIWSVIVGRLLTPLTALAAPVSPVATAVYGQGGSFTTNTDNKGGISANSLSGPSDVAVDSNGNLYVADTNNNRALFFPAGSTTATRVYGQGGSFTTNANNKGGVSADSLSGPQGVAVDSNGNLYVADTKNNRALFFPGTATTAARVYGQRGDFSTNNPNRDGLDANTLKGLQGLALDSSNNLSIADTDNSRVLFYAGTSTTATRVYGQSGNFTSGTANNGGISANSLNKPTNVALDAGNDLYVADASNNRALFYSGASTTATRVYGQAGSFTSNTENNAGISASSLKTSGGITISSQGNIYIADTNNNRVLAFQTALRITTQPPASMPMNAPFGLAANVVDVGSNRVFTDFTGTVSVAIKPGSGTPGATLNGSTSVVAASGVATFSNLSIDQSGAGYILTASSPGVGSADTNPFMITGLLLFIPLNPPSFSFTLNGSPGVAFGQRTLRVSDTTQSGVGWHLAITSTQFTAPGGKTLPPTDITITQVTFACTSGHTCVLPTNTVRGYPLTVPAGTLPPPALTYFSAAGGTGTGDVSLMVTYALHIAPGTAAGTYTSTFTEALVKG